ncbi:MAG: patatin-like phospholipase family protein [Bacillota bacterium]|nr:patatin-like phospholipase family protein [Bacillota bacterium]
MIYLYTLCLSGGGFRAALFHLGVIRRLIYLDIFKKVKRINSVSGGSIAAGMVMKEYTINGMFNSVEDFDKRVIVPIIDFIQQSPKHNIYKIIPVQKDSKKFEKLLDKYLYNQMLFSELSKDIKWVCYATSLNSMMAWKFSQTSIGDLKTGFTTPGDKDKISFAVSASACFPPLFKPVRFVTEGRVFSHNTRTGSREAVINKHPAKEILLVDGGVYDNLSSESVLRKDSSFIISDSTSMPDIWENNQGTGFEKLKRFIDISLDQNSKLRRRLIFKKLSERQDSILIETAKNLTTYTTEEIPEKPNPTPTERMPVYQVPPYNIERKIGLIRTDLNAFHDLEIQLILWNGAVKLDAAMKRWVPNNIKDEHWYDTPKLNLAEEELLKSVEILNKGKEMRIYREAHKELHFNEELRVNISQKL